MPEPGRLIADKIYVRVFSLQTSVLRGVNMDIPGGSGVILCGRTGRYCCRNTCLIDRIFKADWVLNNCSQWEKQSISYAAAVGETSGWKS